MKVCTGIALYKRKGLRHGFENLKYLFKLIAKKVIITYEETTINMQNLSEKDEKVLKELTLSSESDDELVEVELYPDIIMKDNGIFKKDEFIQMFYDNMHSKDFMTFKDLEGLCYVGLFGCCNEGIILTENLSDSNLEKVKDKMNQLVKEGRLYKNWSIVSSTDCCN